MAESKEYCGFLCYDLMDRQQVLLDELKEFSKYNPEYAQVMRQKIIDVTKEELDRYTNKS